jgi:hypothetical protein
VFFKERYYSCPCRTVERAEEPHAWRSIGFTCSYAFALARSPFRPDLLPQVLVLRQVLQPVSAVIDATMREVRPVGGHWHGGRLAVSRRSRRTTPRRTGSTASTCAWSGIADVHLALLFFRHAKADTRSAGVARLCLCARNVPARTPRASTPRPASRRAQTTLKDELTTAVWKPEERISCPRAANPTCPLPTQY